MAFVGMMVIVSMFQALCIFFMRMYYWRIQSSYNAYKNRIEKKRKKQKYKEKMAKEKLEEDSDKKLGDGSAS